MENSMSITPLFDRVLIQRKEAPKKTKSGLLLPSSSTEKLNQGIVRSVGNGHVNNDGDIRPLQVDINDVVVFGKFAGNNIVVDGEELLILKEEEILGILESSEEDSESSESSES
jgi:chaperonin GroES